MTAAVIPDPTGLPLHPATVVDVRAETSWCSRVRVAVDAERAAFTTMIPGQYVALAPEGHEARWYVLASTASEAPVVEFLIGRGAEVSDALVASRPGDTVHLSVPQGAGFPMARLAARPVVVFASGTGLAAVKPVIDTLLAGAAPPPIALFYQERLRAEADAPVCEFALTGELARWRAASVAVTLACDASPGGTAELVDLLWQPAADATTSEYVICGSPQLDARVSARLAAAAVRADQVHRNY
jgi:sulfhydrogenase subunit gamma (sulfur reductase)